MASPEKAETEEGGLRKEGCERVPGRFKNVSQTGWFQTKYLYVYLCIFSKKKQQLPKSVVAAIKHYSHRQNVDRGTTGEATKAGGFENYS